MGDAVGVDRRSPGSAAARARRSGASAVGASSALTAALRAGREPGACRVREAVHDRRGGPEAGPGPDVGRRSPARRRTKSSARARPGSTLSRSATESHASTVMTAVAAGRAPATCHAEGSGRPADHPPRRRASSRETRPGLRQPLPCAVRIGAGEQARAPANGLGVVASSWDDGSRFGGTRWS